MPPRKKKIRADFRKNRGSRARQGDWTRHFRGATPDQEPIAGESELAETANPADDAPQDERISGKGDLTRKPRSLPKPKGRGGLKWCWRSIRHVGRAAC